ncbi:MAG: SDR family NAD(P)-dependent oxidoreductase [Steroidobacteraceae bacterium]|nr:SDR family NAD(P)-dependent oxidoreductase [Steroidobacteraceae bacterium]
MGRPLALVTGASSGIGLDLAGAFARAGHDVALVANTPLSRQRELAAEIAASLDRAVAAGPARDGRAAPPAPRIVGYEADVADAASVARLAAAVHADLGTVDVLVNNAGIWTTTVPGVTPLAEFDRLVDVNLRGPYYVCHHFLPPMLARGRGNLIFVGSVSGLAGDPHSAAYSATKAGVAMLARTFAATLGPQGIRVNAIAPGAVATPLTAGLRTPEGEAAIEAMMKSHPSPTRRFFMEPSEISALALFLASEASSALHGAVLVADQGLSATLPR